VNAGDFDPIERLATSRNGTAVWLHIDGAFGLSRGNTARGASRGRSPSERTPSSPTRTVAQRRVRLGLRVRSRRVAPRRGVRDRRAVLPKPASTRCSADADLSITSRTRHRGLGERFAYGRSGHRAMVERHLDLAQRLAARGRRRAGARASRRCPLNIVAFAFRPGICRRGARHAQREDRRGTCSRWFACTVGNNALPRPRRVPAGDRELAHDRGGHRSHRRGRAWLGARLA